MYSGEPTHIDYSTTYHTSRSVSTLREFHVSYPPPQIAFGRPLSVRPTLVAAPRASFVIGHYCERKEPVLCCPVFDLEH